MKIVVNKSFGCFGISPEAERCLKDEYDINSCCDLPRHDKRLVAVVERLGTRANASYSDLRVIEIDDSKYRIVDYDGIEWVETPNTIKWIEVTDEDF